jgi:transposase
MSDVQNQGSPGEPGGKSRRRRHFGDDQKAAIVRRHLADKVPVSDLADEYHLQPSLIYLWVKQVLDQAERAFQQPRRGKQRSAPDPRDRRIAQLEATVAQRDAKLAQKNEVIAELMEDNVRSKKAAGEL